MTAPRPNSLRFSLSSLLAGVSLFCVVVAGLASRIQIVQAYVLTYLALLPTAAVILVLVSISRRRKTMLAVAFFGAVFSSSGCGLPLVFDREPAARTVWEAVSAIVIPYTIASSCGATCVGVLALLLEPPPPWKDDKRK